MRFVLSILAIGFVCVTANGSDSASKTTQVLSEETVQLANGFYNLKSVCIAATSYDAMKSREFCMDDAETVNLLSTDSVMMGASCTPDSYPSRCPHYNAYILRTRMSIY